MRHAEMMVEVWHEPKQLAQALQRCTGRLGSPYPKSDRDLAEQLLSRGYDQRLLAAEAMKFQSAGARKAPKRLKRQELKRRETKPKREQEREACAWCGVRACAYRQTQREREREMTEDKLN